jgi:hypothetical protein
MVAWFGKQTSIAWLGARRACWRAWQLPACRQRRGRLRIGSLVGAGVSGFRGDRSICCDKMLTSLGADISKFTRPRSLFGALVRFFLFLGGAIVLHSYFSVSWSGWEMGLMVGAVAGVIWGVSWRWKEEESRIYAWAIISFGGGLFWVLTFRDFPSLGAFASMCVSYELVLLLLHWPLRRWVESAEQKDE